MNNNVMLFAIAIAISLGCLSIVLSIHALTEQLRSVEKTIEASAHNLEHGCKP